MGVKNSSISRAVCAVKEKQGCTLMLEDRFESLVGHALAVFDLDTSLCLSLSFTLCQIPIRSTLQCFLPRVADISNEITYKKILVNVNLCVWLPVMTRGVDPVGRWFCLARKVCFVYLNQSASKGDPVYFVTDFTTLVILIQLT